MKNLPLASIPVVVTDVGAGCAASNLVIKGDTILVINGVQLTDEIHGRALWPGRQWAWSSSRFSARERT